MKRSVWEAEAWDGLSSGCARGHSGSSSRRPARLHSAPPVRALCASPVDAMESASQGVAPPGELTAKPRKRKIVVQRQVSAEEYQRHKAPYVDMYIHIHTDMCICVYVCV